jgi:uncharacterized iron-regulated membrane protein
VFLLLLCLTGLPLVFHDEIDAWRHPSPVAPGVDNVGPTVRITAILERARERYPADSVSFLSFPDDDRDVVVGMLSDAGTAKQRNHWLAFHPDTAALLDDPVERGQRRIEFMDVMLSLHNSLVAGLAGTLVLTTMGLLFVMALVSGVVLYVPFMSKLAFGSVRLTQSRRTGWLDLHNLLGIVTLAWMMVVGITGVINTLERPLFALWESSDLDTRLRATGRTISPPASVCTPARALLAADAASPGRRRASMLFPSTEGHHPFHYLVWSQGDTLVSRELLVATLVSADSCIVDARVDLPWYLRALELSRPFHFGNYGGLPLKVLWALFDLVTIAVLISGLAIWIGKRRTTRQRNLA